MKMEEVFKHTFKAMRKQLDEQRGAGRRMWQLRQGTSSEFCRAVVSNGYLTEEQMQRAAQRYRLGASRNGGVIFWQIDEFDLLRDGKIMYYRTDCHRDHDRKPTWTSYLMRKSGQLPKDWNTDHCLFGLHLLTQSFFKGHTDLSDLTDDKSHTEITENTERPKGQMESFPSDHAQPVPKALSVESVRSVCDKKTVCVVEAEKTAVIMSEVKPEYVWMATGGKTELNVAKLRPLAGHRIILFPDTDEDGQTYRDWYDVAEAASDVFSHPVTVSSILEQHATTAQKAAKIDLVDLLFTRP